jgi:hypothetical protein
MLRDRRPNFDRFECIEKFSKLDPDYEALFEIEAHFAAKQRTSLTVADKRRQPQRKKTHPMLWGNTLPGFLQRRRGSNVQFIFRERPNMNAFPFIRFVTSNSLIQRS